jgi:Fe-S oxidoreductase
MLDTAKGLLRDILDHLHHDIEDGVPVVGLEPACVAAFRDELVNLFPKDDAAQRLAKQSFLFGEFLDCHCHDLDLPRVEGKALVQIHCHHHAVLKPDSEARVLDRLGVDYEVMKSGCCGMAGAFGFEAEKYDVSMRAAERVLLPKVRGADRDTLILADGFSCREQIQQGAGRRTLHLADLVARGMRLDGADGALDGGRSTHRLMIAGGIALAAAGLYLARREARRPAS